MSKFKIGDRVITTPHVHDGIPAESRGTVWYILEESKPQLRVDFDEHGRKWGIYASNFELESVYDSPLYQALK